VNRRGSIGNTIEGIIPLYASDTDTLTDQPSEPFRIQLMSFNGLGDIYIFREVKG
jgi:hypothetical protein